MADPEKGAGRDEERKRGADGEEHVSVRESVRARIERPHKGDVGRPETNEEIYQGSKTRELK